MVLRAVSSCGPTLPWLAGFGCAGRRRIPAPGGVLVVVNHVGDLDPACVGVACVPRPGQYLADARGTTATCRSRGCCSRRGLPGAGRAAGHPRAALRARASSAGEPRRHLPGGRAGWGPPMWEFREGVGHLASRPASRWCRRRSGAYARVMRGWRPVGARARCWWRSGTRCRSPRRHPPRARRRAHRRRRDAVAGAARRRWCGAPVIAHAAPPAPVIVGAAVSFGHDAVRLGPAPSGSRSRPTGASPLRRPPAGPAAHVRPGAGGRPPGAGAAPSAGAARAGRRPCGCARCRGAPCGRPDPRLRQPPAPARHRAPVAGEARDPGVYVQHLVTGCGAAVNADAQFPAASTLKAAILVNAVRRGRADALRSTLDRMIIDSDDGAANSVLAALGGGSGDAGARRYRHAPRARPRPVAGAPPVHHRGGPPAAPIRTDRSPALSTNFITTPYELARLMVAVHRGAVGRGGVARLGIGVRAARAELLARFLDVRERSKLVAGLPARRAGGPQDRVHGARSATTPGSSTCAAARSSPSAMTWSASAVRRRHRRAVHRARSPRPRAPGSGTAASCDGLPLNAQRRRAPAAVDGGRRCWYDTSSLCADRYLYGSRPPPISICTTPRSGGTLLARRSPAPGSRGARRSTSSSWAATGLPRRPVDYLEGLDAPELPTRVGRARRRHRVEPIFDQRRFAGFGRLRRAGSSGPRRTSNGVFGAKIMSAYVDGLATGLRDALGDRAPDATPRGAGGGVPAPALRLPRRAMDKVRPGRLALARHPDLAVARGRRARPAVAPPRRRPGYSFAALDHLRGGSRGGGWWRRLLRPTPASEPLTWPTRSSPAHTTTSSARSCGTWRSRSTAGVDACPSPTMRRQADSALGASWAARSGRARRRRGGRPRVSRRPPNILYLHSHDTGRYVQPYGSAVPHAADPGGSPRRACCSARPSARPRPARPAAPAC